MKEFNRRRNAVSYAAPYLVSKILASIEVAVHLTFELAIELANTGLWFRADGRNGTLYSTYLS